MSENKRPSVVILAAGVGSRMKSRLHKVLHPIAGQPMIDHLLDSVETLEPAKSVVVVGQWREQVEEALASRGCAFAVQDEQLGTGHAVQQSRNALGDDVGPVLILFGDVPMVTADTMRGMIERLDADDAPGVVVLGFEPEDSKAYGRIITMGDDTIDKMVEARDASPEELKCRLCNSGIMAVDGARLFGWLDQVGNDNAAGEYYLPDIVRIARRDGARPVVVKGSEREVTGINSRAELAAAEAQWQEFTREEAMANGVTLRAPETVFFSYDTEILADAVIEQNVVFGPGVRIGEGAKVRAFTHLEGCAIGAEAEVGPYARIRPGTSIGAQAKVGNFVEMKKTSLGASAKANHLSYIGDAEVGAGANIGAGTITCNYDGFGKHKTQIGATSFIGSNSALVAPVTIGTGAIVGAGSVITSDVPAGAIAVARGDQKNLEGKAQAFRDRAQRKKDKK